MAFPSSSVSVPTLSSYQMSFAGLTMGPGTAYEFQKIEGLDVPDVRNGDAGRARDHGTFIGLDLMAGRTITLTLQVAASGSTSFQTAWSQLAGVTVPGGTTETPLFFNLPGWGTLATMARVRRRQMPIDIQFALGNLADCTIQFACSDPRLYSTPTQSVSVSPPGTSAGFSFPMSFPLSFGGGTVAGVISATNSGNIEVRPQFTITGPCTNPSITNASATGSPNLTFVLTMNSGDTLVVDTDMHTATYFTAGSTTGSTRAYLLASGSQWFSLLPGTNTIQFLTGDSVASGSLACAWASGYIL